MMRWVMNTEREHFEQKNNDLFQRRGLVAELRGTMAFPAAWHGLDASVNVAVGAGGWASGRQWTA
jgi:hypothetical protein